MRAEEVLATLEQLGKPQTAAIYRRHGAGTRVFGVLTSEIAKLRKRIRCDHGLGLELWKSGFAEARVLALQIFDPARLTRSDAEGWLDDGPVRFVGGDLAELLARSPIGEGTMHAWMESTGEARRETGYAILSHRLKNDPDSLTDDEAASVLATIEREIHGSPNRARHAMNGALISIGIYKPVHREAAIRAAERIGTVEVDHGQTNCRTPDAIAYIENAARRSAAGRSRA